MNINVSEYIAPPENIPLSNDYAVGLFSEIKNVNPDFVFCLRYFSAVSLVCNTAKVKYVAWICKSYEPDIYSCTLLNDTNYIFFADKSLADDFSGDFKNIFFLPFGVNAERIKSLVNTSDTEYDSNITMMQNVRKISDVEDTPLFFDSPIKDSTRGYLWGSITCQRQIKGLPSMAGTLPDYVWEDLQHHYPPQISGESIETPVHFYDCKYFNPLITYMQRESQLNYLVAKEEDKFEEVHLYNNYESMASDKITVHEQADYYTGVPIIARKSRLNLVIVNRNWQTAIPQISWDIMAAGGFTISTIQRDYYEIFEDTIPVMYEDKYDMFNKAKYFLKNENEREQIAKALSEEVNDRHTYENRINEMLGKI
jgi:hypothetical protein